MKFSNYDTQSLECSEEEHFKETNRKFNEKIDEILTEEKLTRLFKVLIEIRNANINYFCFRNAFSFEESSDNENYKRYRNQSLFKTLLQFFDIIAYYVFSFEPYTSVVKGAISFQDFDNVEKKIKERVDEDNFVLVDTRKYVFSGVSLERDLKDLYNNIDTDIDID